MNHNERAAADRLEAILPEPIMASGLRDDIRTLLDALRWPDPIAGFSLFAAGTLFWDRLDSLARTWED